MQIISKKPAGVKFLIKTSLFEKIKWYYFKLRGKA